MITVFNVLACELCACGRKNNNKDQSNLLKGGIAESSFLFAWWQHRTDLLAAVHVLAGSSIRKSSLSLGVSDPHLTQCVT